MNNREYNPLGRRKKFVVRKHKLVFHKPDLKTGLSYNKISDGEELDYNEFGGKQKEVTRSMLVKQHDRAVLLSYKQKKRNKAPKTKKTDVSEVAQRLWRNFPDDLKRELRRTLKDSNHDGTPDAFE